MKNEIRDWNNIAKCDIWKFSENKSKIIPALRISYHYLPSHLKRCFVYCSLYPKDYQFNKDELILLWMAEDLLQASEDGRILEEMGYEYFDELVSRSLFQPHSTNESLFVLHHLMHDLATFCAGEFYFRAEELRNAAKVDVKTRHVSHNAKGNYPLSKLLATCDRVKYTRTFLEINSSQWDPFIKENAPSILLSKLKYLRVLSFNSFPLDHDSLPDSIGELIHLRYLDLSNTPIALLPESLSNLYNLLVLKLNDCYWLKKLPTGLQDLVNLRHLDIRRTSVEEMPKGMGKLKHLQVLSDYIVGKREENGIRELGALNNLHGSLSISKLENIINSDEALKASMIEKKHINILCMNWSLDDEITDSKIERDILDMLQPHVDLKVLSIEGYRGTIFSDWLGHSSYHNMTKLTLGSCGICCILPSLGQLPFLKHLLISDFKQLKIVGSEFYRNDESCHKTPFPSLEVLEFYHMSCWQEWCSFELDTFPQLKQLTVSNCPNLVGDLPNYLPNLEKLIIRECKQLACSLPRVPAICKLRILGEHGVRMQDLPLLLSSLSIEGSKLVDYVFESITHTQPTCLKSLSISNCSSVLSIPAAPMLASLQKLEIRKCKKLEFPMQQRHELLRSIKIVNSCDSLTAFVLETFPNLMELKIKSCENLKSLVVSQSQDAILSCLRSLCLVDCPSFVSFSTLGTAAPQLNYLRVERCPKIDLFPIGGMPPNLRELHIRESEKLVSCLASMDLHSHGLIHLEIKGECDNVKSFPKEGCLPATLQSLHVLSLSGLEMFNCKGLLHLTSLRNLTIADCPRVEIMARERLPASLIHISINGSPLSDEYSQMKNLQVWPKISLIRGNKVDLRWIS